MLPFTADSNGVSLSSRPSEAVPEPGPWAGEVLRLVPGEEIETRLVLDAHDDPIAQHHTLGGRKISASRSVAARASRFSRSR